MFTKVLLIELAAIVCCLYAQNETPQAFYYPSLTRQVAPAYASQRKIPNAGLTNYAQNSAQISNIQTPSSYAVSSSSVPQAKDDDLNNDDARYEYKYGILDPDTGDKKLIYEQRDEKGTRGQYSYVQPDGTTLTVSYVDDGKSGFNAVVTKSGVHK